MYTISQHKKIHFVLLLLFDTIGIISTILNNEKIGQLFMSNWTTRIKLRMKELGMTQEILANKMGITRGAVTHYLAGRRVPPLKQFNKLAVILKTDPAWLQFGISTETPTNKKTPKLNTTTIAHKKIPILSWEQLAEHIDTKNIPENTFKDFVPNFYTDKTHWYALRVKGDAMTSPLGQSKSFHAGDILIIDPDKNAENGDFVIALLPKSKEATFKQYVIDGGVRYLKPLNSQYPIIQIDDSALFCGVLTTLINLLIDINKIH